MLEDRESQRLEIGGGGLLDRLPLENMRFAFAGRGFTVEAVRDQDRLLEIAGHKEPFPFGLTLWESAVVGAQVLADRLPSLTPKPRVLELGAGVGLCGIVAAALGADVVQTDHSVDALELCRRNASANGIGGIAWATRDWRAWDDPVRYDLVVGADILYESGLHLDILRVLEASVGAKGRVLLTDPARGDTASFIETLRSAGWKVDVERRTVAALPPCTEGACVAVDVIDARRID